MRRLTAIAALPLLLAGCGGGEDGGGDDSDDRIVDLADLAETIGCTDFEEGTEGGDGQCQVDGKTVYLSDKANKDMMDEAAAASAAAGITYAMDDEGWTIYSDDAALVESMADEFDAHIIEP